MGGVVQTASGDHRAGCGRGRCQWMGWYGRPLVTKRAARLWQREVSVGGVIRTASGDQRAARLWQREVSVDGVGWEICNFQVQFRMKVFCLIVVIFQPKV